MKLFCVLLCLIFNIECLQQEESSFENRLQKLIKQQSLNSTQSIDYDNNQAFQSLMADYTLLDRLSFLKSKLKILLGAVKDMKKPLRPGAIPMLKSMLKEMKPQFTGGNLDDNSLKQAFNLSNQQIDQFHNRYADAKVLLFKLNAALNKRSKLDSKT